MQYLLCWVPRITAGASQLEAEDWDTGNAVTIPLDTTITPMEVAEGLYKRARKLRRAVDAVQPLLEAAQQELEYLESVSGPAPYQTLQHISIYTGSIW
jgi:predicted ribosome quality control (RQC) complex YloA/Tae2 family protein